MIVKIKATSNKKHKKSKNGYVDNDKLYQALVDYNKEKIYNENNNLPKPIISDYIAECFILIAKNISNVGGFVNYLYKEDMIQDSILNCVSCIGNFDVEKYKNPFGYFSMVICFGFVRRIKIENKDRYIKYKSFQEFMPEVDEENFVLYCKKNDYYLDESKISFISSYEEKIKEKKERVLAKKG